MRTAFPKPVTNATNWQSFGTGLDQQPKNIEPQFLGERGQCGYSVQLLHISRMIEIWLPVKGAAFVQSESRQLENADPDPVNRLSFFLHKSDAKFRRRRRSGEIDPQEPAQ